MIKGQVKTEANYRAKAIDSSSSLKEFSMDRKKYYRKYILHLWLLIRWSQQTMHVLMYSC